MGAAAAGAGIAASAITKTTRLAATDGFRLGKALRNGAFVGDVVKWGPFTQEQLQDIRKARAHSSPEPPPGVQIENARSSPSSSYIPPTKPHSNEPVRVVYFTGHPGTLATQYPAEFSRQLARQYEALSYITVADYIKYRDKTARARTPEAIKRIRNDLRKAIAENLVYLGLKKEKAQKKAREAVGMLAALHEPDQILQGPHALAATEAVWGNRYVNSSLGPQHKANAALLDDAAQTLQKLAREENREEDLKHYYLNVEVVLCKSPILAEQIRQDMVTIIPASPEHALPSPYTSVTIDSLTREASGQTTPTRAPPAQTAPAQTAPQPGPQPPAVQQATIHQQSTQQPTPRTQQKQPTTPEQQEKELAARYPGFANLPPAAQQHLRDRNNTTTPTTQKQQKQQEKQPTTPKQQKQPTTTRQQEKELATRYPGFANLPPAAQQRLREKNSTTHHLTTTPPTLEPKTQKGPRR